MSLRIYWPTSILGLLLLINSAQALTIEDAKLLKKEKQLYQAWVLSRDYLFGTTRKPDPIKALAWQLAYLDLLPKSYPGKENLVIMYQKGLASSQISDAQKLAQILSTQYDLTPPFSEVELYRVYTLHEENLSGLQSKTGVVGRVIPWFGIEKSNMILRRADDHSGLLSALPLTVTNNGQFYATGLSPGRYELFINTAGLNTKKEFTIRKGEIRGLSLIDLHKFLRVGPST